MESSMRLHQPDCTADKRAGSQGALGVASVHTEHSAVQGQRFCVRLKRFGDQKIGLHLVQTEQVCDVMSRDPAQNVHRCPVRRGIGFIGLCGCWTQKGMFWKSGITCTTSRTTGWTTVLLHRVYVNYDGDQL